MLAVPAELLRQPVRRLTEGEQAVVEACIDSCCAAIERQRPRRTRRISSRINPIAPAVMAASATLKAGK